MLQRHPDHVELDPYVAAHAAERAQAETIALEFGVRLRIAREALTLVEEEGLEIETAVKAGPIALTIPVGGPGSGRAFPPET